MPSAVGMADDAAVKMGLTTNARAAARRRLLDSSGFIERLREFKQVSAYTYIVKFKHLR